METLFLRIVNISIMAGWIVLAVMLIRLPLKKAPRFISCILWGIVGLRLLIPFRLESIFSLIPSAETVPETIAENTVPVVDSGFTVLNSPVNSQITRSFEAAPAQHISTVHSAVQIASYIWLAGIAVMLIYSFWSYIRLKVKLRTAIRKPEKYYVSDRIPSPFLLGIIRPQIYVNADIDEKDLMYVLAHERAHIRRLDHIWKPLAFLLLSVYWFNPLLWLAYILLCRDIEAACDEKVIGTAGSGYAKNYSTALLNASISRRSIAACPVAFGEVSVKTRIKRILNYKKTPFWIILISLIVCIAAAVCLLTVPKKKSSQENTTAAVTETEKQTAEEQAAEAAFESSASETEAETDAVQPAENSSELEAIIESEAAKRLLAGADSKQLFIRYYFTGDYRLRYTYANTYAGEAGPDMGWYVTPLEGAASETEIRSLLENRTVYRFDQLLSESHETSCLTAIEFSNPREDRNGTIYDYKVTLKIVGSETEENEITGTITVNETENQVESFYVSDASENAIADMISRLAISTEAAEEGVPIDFDYSGGGFLVKINDISVTDSVLTCDPIEDGYVDMAYVTDYPNLGRPAAEAGSDGTEITAADGKVFVCYEIQICPYEDLDITILPAVWVKTAAQTYQNSENWLEYSGTWYKNTVMDTDMQQAVYRGWIEVDESTLQNKEEPAELQITYSTSEYDDVQYFVTKEIPAASFWTSQSGPIVDAVYEANTEEDTAEDEFMIFETFYEMSDGTWRTETGSYKYRLEITGRSSNASKDTTYLYLSNLENISFKEAMMASGLSSNTDDYFDEKDAKFVGMK